MFTNNLNNINYFTQILYTNYLDILLIVFFSATVWGVISSTVVRVKFIYYIFALLISSVWGFYASCDIFIMFLLMSEFFIILLLLLAVITNSKLIILSKKISNIYYFLFNFLNLTMYFTLLNYNTTFFIQEYFMFYFLKLNLISSDLYIFFFFFCVDQILSIFFFTGILSLFSIFFISCYIRLKLYTNDTVIYDFRNFFLHRQDLRKQRGYKAPVRIFKQEVFM